MSLPPPAQQLVDGKLVGAVDTYPILNPATGREVGVAPDATATHAPSWSRSRRTGTSAAGIPRPESSTWVDSVTTPPLYG